VGVCGSVLRTWRPRSWLVSVVLLAAFLPVTSAQAQPGDRFAALLDERMPALLERYGVSGSVVAVIEDGDVAGTAAYGLADVSTGSAMRSDMVLEFGSCGKVITAWAVMRLVEDGKVDLDAPVDDYLARWQVGTRTEDAEEVTVGRLLSHTAGLNMHGYVDHSLRRVHPPDLVGTLTGVRPLEGLGETVNTGRLSLGTVELVQEPGSGYRYSGAGYGLLQLLIEDVTGEPFASFVQREITDPLGASSLRWVWTSELQERAPTPYSDEGRPVEYRQLSMHGIGSEIGTVADFARVVAAAVGGPAGEPAGRGVLRPDTVARMLAPWWEAGFDRSLAYPLGQIDGARTVWHSGANTGWMAYFVLDVTRREGFVIASPSNRADPLHRTVFDLWLDATYGPGARTTWPPVPTIGPLSWLLLSAAALLNVLLAVAVLRLVRRVRTGRRPARRPPRTAMLAPLPWTIALLFGWYTIYSSLPLYLPAWYPDLWRTTGSDVLMVTLTAWVAFSVARACWLVRQPTRPGVESHPYRTLQRYVPRASMYRGRSGGERAHRQGPGRRDGDAARPDDPRGGGELRLRDPQARP
jgi:CubicO group peptidase (beta-lactamase class C family)